MRVCLHPRQGNVYTWIYLYSIPGVAVCWPEAEGCLTAWVPPWISAPRLVEGCPPPSIAGMWPDFGLPSPCVGWAPRWTLLVARRRSAGRRRSTGARIPRPAAPQVYCSSWSKHGHGVRTLLVWIFGYRLIFFLRGESCQAQRGSANFWKAHLLSTDHPKRCLNRQLILNRTKNKRLD